MRQPEGDLATILERQASFPFVKAKAVKGGEQGLKIFLGEP